MELHVSVFALTRHHVQPPKSHLQVQADGVIIRELVGVFPLNLSLSTTLLEDAAQSNGTRVHDNGVFDTSGMGDHACTQ